MKNTVLWALMLLAGITFWAKGLHAQFAAPKIQTPEQPVVIELFTSQSCSSCPAADRNLAALGDNPNIIALGFHVTYWDHLHWKDTLGREFATERQRAYAAHKRLGRVYTPQMIVNGGAQFVGSRKGDLNAALQAAPPIARIEAARQGAKLDIGLPQTSPGTYTLWVAGIHSQKSQKISSGENAGRMVEYTNAVLSLDNAGNWDGGAEARTLNLHPGPNIDHYVVLAQKDGYGAITAAGKSY